MGQIRWYVAETGRKIRKDWHCYRKKIWKNKWVKSADTWLKPGRKIRKDWHCYRKKIWKNKSESRKGWHYQPVCWSTVNFCFLRLQWQLQYEKCIFSLCPLGETQKAGLCSFIFSMGNTNLTSKKVFIWKKTKSYVKLLQGMGDLALLWIRKNKECCG